MIYELMIFVSELSGDAGLAGSKMFPTEAACMEAGGRFRLELRDKGLAVDFRCEPRPDDFVRGDDGKPASKPVSTARSTPVPAKVRVKPAPQGAAQNAQIERAVLKILSDPDSARFRDHRPFQNKADGDQVACVMVNAKNKMGGYAGFGPYLVYRKPNGSTIAAEGFVNCSLSLQAQE